MRARVLLGEAICLRRQPICPTFNLPTAKKVYASDGVGGLFQRRHLLDLCKKGLAPLYRSDMWAISQAHNSPAKGKRGASLAKVQVTLGGKVMCVKFCKWLGHSWGDVSLCG